MEQEWLFSSIADEYDVRSELSRDNNITATENEVDTDRSYDIFSSLQCSDITVVRRFHEDYLYWVCPGNLYEALEDQERYERIKASVMSGEILAAIVLRHTSSATIEVMRKWEYDNKHEWCTNAKNNVNYRIVDILGIRAYDTEDFLFPILCDNTIYEFLGENLNPICMECIKHQSLVVGEDGGLHVIFPTCKKVLTRTGLLAVDDTFCPFYTEHVVCGNVDSQLPE